MAGGPACFVALELGARIAAEPFEAVMEQLDVAGVIEGCEAEGYEGRHRPAV